MLFHLNIIIPLVILFCSHDRTHSAFINEYTSISHVITLTDGRFIAELDKYPLALVAFYAPWCHFSKELLPELEIASRIVAFIREVKVIEIDCWTNGKNTCDAQKIQGYPTVKIFKHGKFYKDYTGARKACEIINELISVHNGAVWLIEI